MPAASTLGKRTRSNREHATSSPSAKRVKSDYHIFNDENQDPHLEVPKTPSKPAKTWVLSSARKPLTPRTPRFRDLSDSAPSTHTHDASLLKPSRVPTNPKTPITPGSIQTVYHLARQLLSRSSEPVWLVGRDNERDQITHFLQRCQKPRPGGCLYVSGPPGTGKSAMVCKVTQQATAGFKSVRQAYINCMSIKSSRELYATLLDVLYESEPLDEPADPLATLKSMFLPPRKPADTFLVVLDEVDHLLTFDTDSLYTLFELALQKTSRLVLIGIANALDLTDRFLPRLKSRNLKPELLPFLPYTSAQIKDIISSRLKSLLPQDCAKPDFIPFIHPAAIELCSRKVASHSGDLRLAFEICRRAIDLMESHTKEALENEARECLMLGSPSRTVLGENKNLSSPRKPNCSPSSIHSSVSRSLQELTVETAPRVSISHLNKVTAAAFSNGASHRLKTLNLQQKAALCSLVALERRNRSIAAGIPLGGGKWRTAGAAPTIKELYDAYCKLCTREEVLHPLSNSEFREVMGSLEALSLIGPVDGKVGSLVASPAAGKRAGRRSASAGHTDDKRVASSVNEQDMEKSLDGAGSGILRRILCGEEALD